MRRRTLRRGLSDCGQWLLSLLIALSSVRWECVEAAHPGPTPPYICVQHHQLLFYSSDLYASFLDLPIPVTCKVNIFFYRQ